MENGAPPIIRGAILPLTFCGSKADATFWLAMISIGSGLNPRIATLSQEFLTLKWKMGPRQLLADRNPPTIVVGQGGPSSAGSKAAPLARNDFNRQRLETARIATLSQQLSDAEMENGAPPIIRRITPPM